MVHVKIVINRKNDTEPAFPDAKENYKGELMLNGIAILEHGTESGNTSLTFDLEGPDGSRYMAQTTAKIFDAAWHALQGAEQRFKENPV